MNGPPDKPGTTMTPVGVLSVGGGLVVAGLVLGVVSAFRFRSALQFSAASCGLAIGHGIAWIAVTIDVVGIALATVAVLAEYRRLGAGARPVLVVVGSVVAGAGVFGAALNLFIVHEIDVCAALFG